MPLNPGASSPSCASSVRSSVCSAVRPSHRQSRRNRMRASGVQANAAPTSASVAPSISFSRCLPRLARSCSLRCACSQSFQAQSCPLPVAVIITRRSGGSSFWPIHSNKFKRCSLSCGCSVSAYRRSSASISRRQGATAWKPLRAISASNSHAASCRSLLRPAKAVAVSSLAATQFARLSSRSQAPSGRLASSSSRS